MRKPKDRNRNRGSIRLILLIVSLMIMLASGSAQMLWHSANRLVTGEGPECMAIRAISGAVVRIHCHKTGFGKARLIGVVTPDFMQPACREEWIAGIGAWWYLQTEMSRARVSRIRFQDVGGDLVREAHLFFDGGNVARKLIREGIGREPGTGADNRWCQTGFR